MAKLGRPLKEIDPEQFQYLCKMMCTKEEIAGFFRCSEDTIERFCKRTYRETFAVVYKIFSAEGRISLRRIQFRLAEDNPAMAIFLGKQYLGQSDRVSQTITNITNDTRMELQELLDSIDGEEQT